MVETNNLTNEEAEKIRNFANNNMDKIMNSGSRYTSHSFNPISTDNQLNYSCNYKPNPVPRLENLYTYKNSEKIKPQQYNTYSDIIGGEIDYFPNRRTVLDNFKKPNFQNKAFITSKLYRDPMGSLKPEYSRTEVENKINVDQLNWMKDTCEWREQLIAKQMTKDNQTRYDPKWNF